jgi:hypothetical protein
MVIPGRPTLNVSVSTLFVAPGSTVMRPPLVTSNLAGHVEPVPWAYFVIVVVTVAAIILFVLEVFVLAVDVRGGRAARQGRQEEPRDRDPRRFTVLAMSVASVFGTDMYVGMPNSFFAGEAGLRDANAASTMGYFAAFALGGLLATVFSNRLLDLTAPNSLNRLSLLLSCGTASVQGLGSLIGVGAGQMWSFLALPPAYCLTGTMCNWRAPKCFNQALMWAPYMEPQSASETCLR